MIQGLSYILEQMTRGKVRLRRFEIDKCGVDVVHGCQLRCIGCPNSTIKPEIKYMDPADFRTILCNLDVDFIRSLRLFNFGESTLHPDLPGIVEQVKGNKWEVKTVEISTNAQHHNFRKLEEALKVGAITLLVVSCDGDGTPVEYERLRPPGKWEKLVEFLSKVSELQKKYAPDVTLMTRTICETDEGKARWTKLLEPLGWRPQFRRWINLPNSLRSPGSGQGVGKGLCVYMSRINHCYVDSDGTVMPCCVHPLVYTLGNLLDQKYSEILYGEPRRKLTKLLEAGRSDLDICKSCEF